MPFVKLPPLSPELHALMLEVRAALEGAEVGKPAPMPAGLMQRIEDRMREEALARRRLEWLHSSESSNVDGWEWGVFRVRWLADGVGSVAIVEQTLSDYSDIDAAMTTYEIPCVTENRKTLPAGYEVWATECQPSDEPGAWTCKECGFRGFWRGGPHCGPAGGQAGEAPCHKYGRDPGCKCGAICARDAEQGRVFTHGVLASEPFTAKAKGIVAGDGQPCPNDHDPDCRWPECLCRTRGVASSRGKTVAREAAAPSPHPGWKLVPIEPTPIMLAAVGPYSKDQLAADAIYRAMLAASPQAAAPASEVEKDAARYRWLRDENNGDSDITPFFAGQGLDEAIDAAMGVSAPAQQTKEQP